MRVAHVVPHGVHPYSGVLASIINLTAALAQRGNQIELWQPNPLPENASEFVEKLEAAGVERIQLRTRESPWLPGAGVVRQVTERAVPLVHLHGAMSPFNNFLARHLRSPYVLSPHGGYAPAVLRRHALRKALFRAVFERRLLTGASLVCALSEAEKEEVRRVGFEGTIEVIPNGVDIDHQKPDGRAFRYELGIDPNTRLAIFVGRLDLYYKRLDKLVEAMRSVAGWHLAIVGPDWRGSTRILQRLINRSRLGTRVHLVSPRRGEALKEALAAADLFVLMSRSEGFPIALLEALALGTPALVSAEVDRTTAITAAEAGWSATPDQLASCLNRLADLGRDQWDRRSQSARNYAAEYRWDDIARSYERRIADAIPDLRQS